MKRLSLLLLIALLAALPFAALAQDATAEPTAPADEPPIENPLPPVEEDLTEEATFLETILRLVSDVTYIPSAAAGVIVFTSAISLVLFKVFGFALSGASRMLLALAIQVVVWVAYVLLTRAGLQTQFNQWYETVVTFVQAILPLFGAVAFGHVGYEKMKEWGVPVLGYKPPRNA